VLIGTKSTDGVSNLSIVNSTVHIGTNPAMLGYILRPTEEVRRHTYENILENEVYTVNHIHRSFVEKAHYTSAKFEADVSEFSACQLTEEYMEDFQAPFVKESVLKMGLRHVETVKITSNNTLLVIGEIEHLVVPDQAIDDRGYLNLGMIEDVGISGLNTYYSLEKIAEFPYARVEEVPDFQTK
ncbi:MAG: flavin reductase, partial [Bacteroidota bacterium]